MDGRKRFTGRCNYEKINSYFIKKIIKPFERKNSKGFIFLYYANVVNKYNIRNAVVILAKFYSAKLKFTKKDSMKHKRLSSIYIFYIYIKFKGSDNILIRIIIFVA